MGAMGIARHHGRGNAKRQVLKATVCTLALTLGAAGTVLSSGSALAQQQPAAVAQRGLQATVSYNIPAQDMNTALLAFADRSGLEIFFEASRVQGLRSPGLKGAHLPRQALTQLLRGTGLTYNFVGNNYVRIERAATSGETKTGTMELTPVVVSATGYEQQVTDAPATVTVITAEELKGKSYSSITEILDTVPGITIQSSGSGKLPGSTTINMRGMSESYILFLVDGRPLGDSQDAYYNGFGSGQKTLLLPPPAAIERIEIIRGPMSSLYGSSASGGLINIITKKAADRWTGSLTLGQTIQENDASSNALQSSYYLTGPLIQDRLGLTFYGSTYDRDPDEFQGGYSGSQRRANGARLSLAMTEDQDLYLDYSRTEQESTNTAANSTGDSGVESTRDDYALTHRIRWGNGIETTSFLNQEKVDVENSTNYSTYEKLNFNSKTLMSFGDHILTAGLDYRTEETDHQASRFPGSVSTDLERWHGALFLEDDWLLTEDFTLTLGGRFDRNEHYGSHFTPRAYGVYHMTGDLTLKGGISGGYKVPALKQADDGIVEQAGRGRGWDKGNSSLQPEESTNYEMGVVWDAPQGFQLGVTVYHTRFSDKIGKEYFCESPDPNVPSCTYNGETRQWIQQYVNLDEAEINGVEATLDFDIGDVDVGFNYTFADSEITSGSNVGAPLNALPRHTVNLMLDWDVDRQLSLWSKVKYRSETNEVLNADRTPGYMIADVGSYYKFTDNVSGFLAVYNLFDKEITNETYGSVLDGRRLYVGLTTSF